MRTALIHLGAFDYSVRVVFCADLPRAIRLIRRKLDDPLLTVDLLEGRRGCCLHRGDWCPIVWMPRYPRTPREHATLAHECFHATAHAMRWANIPFTCETEEAYTHTMAALVHAALTRLRN